ncbi:MAG: hypothetical protein WBG36_00645 [Ornithinimicrobium sp.]
MGSHTPPQDVQKAAQRAQQWIEDGRAGKGFSDVGRKRAQQLADGESVSDEVIERMRNYFSRHAPDKDAKGFTQGGEGFPSPGRVAWDAWGGDPGERWADSETLDDD